MCTLSALNKEQRKKPGEGQGVGEAGGREIAVLRRPLPVQRERGEGAGGEREGERDGERGGREGEKGENMYAYLFPMLIISNTN